LQPQNIKIIIIKKFIFFTSVLLLFVNAISINTKLKEDNTKSYPKFIEYNIPYLQNNFVAFKQALAFKESQGKYTAVNTLGYLGKYQFGRTTLERFEIYDTESFLQDPELQEKAFTALCKVNNWILRKDIKRSVGKTINGIKITESGIIAAAHLGGAGSVKKFLRSNGAKRFSDAYGSSIQAYLKKFAGYDVSNIVADRKAKT
jgi:hypothetical protein